MIERRKEGRKEGERERGGVSSRTTQRALVCKVKERGRKEDAPGAS
jgi:hypothetical protein